MSELLQKAVEKDITEYSSLIKPVFVGQTAVDNDNTYWVVVESQNVLYKFRMTL